MQRKCLYGSNMTLHATCVCLFRSLASRRSDANLCSALYRSLRYLVRDQATAEALHRAVSEGGRGMEGAMVWQQGRAGITATTSPYGDLIGHLFLPGAHDDWLAPPDMRLSVALGCI